MSDKRPEENISADERTCYAYIGVTPYTVGKHPMHLFILSDNERRDITAFLSVSWEGKINTDELLAFLLVRFGLVCPDTKGVVPPDRLLLAGDVVTSGVAFYLNKEFRFLALDTKIGFVRHGDEEATRAYRFLLLRFVKWFRTLAPNERYTVEHLNSIITRMTKEFCALRREAEKKEDQTGD